jgi:glucosamine--fructose-6-phosphate aminotransferase (isomerizing)
MIARLASMFAARLAPAARRLAARLPASIHFGRAPASVPPGALILFPVRQTLLGCGIAGLVAFKAPDAPGPGPDPEALEALVETVAAPGADRGGAAGFNAERYLGGAEPLAQLRRRVLALRRPAGFAAIVADPALAARLERLAARLAERRDLESRRFDEVSGQLSAGDAELMAERIETLSDIAWTLRAELLGNAAKVRRLLPGPADAGALGLMRHVNAVLNSIDRMEVRGRDSAGISLLFTLPADDYARFAEGLAGRGLADEFERRCRREPLLNGSITAGRRDGRAALAFTYKVAAEIGSLGDNIRFIRAQIENDRILHLVAALPTAACTVNAHTRWASVGAITEANCHPVDNKSPAAPAPETGIIHASLNGDIDNFLELRESFEGAGGRIHPEVTTDTKIIPLRIEHYLRQGHDVTEAFRRAVGDFQGSHAIAMHTDLAPGKLFLAQRGSGQALFVGLAPDHYMPTSEVYGFIEETSDFIKLDGESVVQGATGPTQGQIVILDRESPGGLAGIRAMAYDGTPVALSAKDIRRTQLTSRDIDRQDYPHYFLKEISESPRSVERTLLNRWKIAGDGSPRRTTALDDKAFPPAVAAALAGGGIRRIFFIGQGTAGVAALACANILQIYLNDPAIAVQAMKASEFSGFALSEQAGPDAMADCLVVAISQSGTTTDTNRSVDMVRERGARTIAIVNRRDSDLTFKVDGVLYTSSGRDIEMSVASTKAFYAQITAGALLGLHIARLRGRRDAAFVSQEIERLLAIPGHMRAVLAMSAEIGAAARRLAVAKTYWATVGSGPNKASADEIRIKLSELCYKTISSDYVEDKKHIDLSSEPLIIVCAAGSRPTVVGDIVKDTAIFKAHKALPVVICDRGEERFDPYAAAVFKVPAVAEHLAPILNTLVGHIFGYHAALAIHEGSRFLFGFHEEVRRTVGAGVRRGADIFEIILEREFREKIAGFYAEFRRQRAERRFPATAGFDAAADLTLLLKYLAGRLPVADFELDFGVKGTAPNMLNVLERSLAEAVAHLARPVDAIKHQAKTVTVGTSRAVERLEGILFAALAAENFSIGQLTPANLLVLKNVQGIIREIEGSILYRIAGLNLLGEPGEETTITVVHKRGKTAAIPSRVETDRQLKGSKRIIVREGNVYLGKGRKDDRSILVVPLLSAEPAGPGRIEHLLLFHVAFQDPVPLAARIRALGGKYEHIKSIVQENTPAWDDAWLEGLPVDELFGRSAEKIAEFIVARQKGP